jgi:carbamoyl-phosphate synthase large subunit
VPAEKGFVVPDLHDPGYIDALVDICHSYHIEAIIPLFDLELPVLAAARDRLASEGIQAVVSSPLVVDICNDKWRSQSFLASHGLSGPRTFLSLASALAALDAHDISLPVYVKPRWGMGSIGVMSAESKEELRVLYARAQEIIRRSYLRIVSGSDPENMVIIQESLAGQEYGLDVVTDLDAKYVTTFTKRKLAMRAGETDAAITTDVPLLQQLGHDIAMRLGHVAVLDVDAFVTPEGARVLEMNPRFGGGYPFSHLAGANVPMAIIAWLRGETPHPSCFAMRTGVTGLKGIVPMRIEEAAILHNPAAARPANRPKPEDVR